MDDQSIKDYINSYYLETEVRRMEDIKLSALKYMYELDPSESNDQNWLSYSNQVCLRRGKKLTTTVPT